MNATSMAPAPLSSNELLDRLADAYNDLTPQVRQAARHMLDRPEQVAVLSMRQLAEAAGVKPNTLVRLARAVGFDGYDDLRDPFRHEVTAPGTSFPDKARWLQTLAGAEHHGDLLADLASSNLGIVEQVFEDLDTVELQTVADTILAAPRTGVFGVGALLPLARHFCYVGSMAVPGLWALPTNEGLPIDDIGRMGAGDVLIAMTFAPYRTEIVEATRLARARDITVVTVTDSRTAPPALDADHVFTTPAETPLFFASVLGVVLLYYWWDTVDHARLTFTEVVVASPLSLMIDAFAPFTKAVFFALALWYGVQLVRTGRIVLSLREEPDASVGETPASDTDH